MAPLKKQPRKSVTAHLAPHQFKKGQSGNPLGRPPGRSLKDRAKAYLAGLTDEEAVEFFEGMNKKDVWEMAEGKAEQKADVTSKGERLVFMPAELLTKNEISDTPPGPVEDSK